MSCSCLEAMAEIVGKGRNGWIVPEDEMWLTLELPVGCIMEFMTVGLDLPEEEEPHGALLVMEVTQRRKRTGGSRSSGWRPGGSHHLPPEQNDQSTQPPPSPLWQRSMPCRARRRNGSSQCCEVFREGGLQGPVYEALGEDGYQGVWRVKVGRRKKGPLVFKPKAAPKKPAAKGAASPEDGKKRPRGGHFSPFLYKACIHYILTGPNLQGSCQQIQILGYVVARHHHQHTTLVPLPAHLGFFPFQPQQGAHLAPTTTLIIHPAP